MLDVAQNESVVFSGQRFQHEYIAQELRRGIESGRFRPGERIATHKVLAQQYDVSAITVRRAITELVREGLLVSRQGLGVFVRDRWRIVRSLGVASTVPFADEIRRAGFEPGVRQISFSSVAAPKVVATRLKIAPSSYVVRHEKLILADGEPISREVTFLPSRIGRRLQSEISNSFIFALLTRHDYEADHIDFYIEGSAATETDAQLFDVTTGFPLVSVGYLFVCVGNRPVATGTILSRSDRLSFNLSANRKSKEARRESRQSTRKALIT